MAYIKNVWVDQDVERPKTYEVTNNQDNTVTLTESFGVVTEIGTPVNAVNMNHIEEGIYTNDTNITTINGKIPSNASSSNKMVTQADLALKADVSQLHALKGYSDEGELLTDAEGLADVKSYAHSTFDSTKFTKVGSPVITDDGIASGFSGNENLYKTSAITISSTGIFNIKTRVYVPSSASNQNVYLNIGNGSDVYKDILLRYEYSLSKLSIIINNGTNGTIASDSQTASTGWHLSEFGYDGTKYYWNIDGMQVYSLTSSTKYPAGIYNVYIGNRGSGLSTNYLSAGSIDLKQFSITVDGKEVFSGNRTGIDTIKPDDYTVVGTPTISADGIITYFNSANKISATSLTATATSVIKSTGRIICNYVPTDLSGNNKFHCFDSIYLYNGFDASGVSVNWFGGYTYQDIIPASAINAGDVFDYILTIDNKNLTSTVEIYKNGSYYITKTQNFTTALTSFLYDINNSGLEYQNTAISVDLNCVKVFIDDNLVYQPCLKIPYTLSKTGSKIVNSVYRDRVADMYTQFGSAPYYTLSDTDFTLPMGEIYGMKVDKINLSPCHVVTETYVNGASWYRVYDDGWCEQGTSVTATSGTWAFLKPYEDTSYSAQMSIYRSSSSSAGYNYHMFYTTKSTTEIGYINADSSLCMLYACGYIS